MSNETQGQSTPIVVPDIGDAEDVEVIEILVSVGDRVSVDDSLLTLESDKASMEIPAASAGIIQTITASIGDKVNTGDVIGQLVSESAAAPAGDDTSTSAAPAVDAPATSDSAPAADATQQTPVAVPDIGDAGDVEVIEVLVSVGDSVEEEQSLVTLESDKASMEVPSPSAGVVTTITVAVGDAVSEGSPLLTLETGASTARVEADASVSKAPPAAPATPPPAATGAPATASSAATSENSNIPRSSASESPTAHLSDESMRKAHASPGVRRYAREHGADLSLVKGTGPKERILKEDVIAFIKQSMEASASNYGAVSQAVGGGAGIPAIPEVDFSKFGPIERVELGRINKLSARNLHRTWLNLPMVTHHDEADITDMEAFRKQLKAEAREGDPKVTGLAFHMKALAATLKVFPKVNSSLAPDGESLFYKQYYHIGIAVDTPAGLVVPVFRDVDKKSINELADEMADVSSRARAKKLKPDEMQGASMTISSLGGIGGTAFTPIVNAPEVAILGITRARMQPVWNGSEFVPRLMCPLDLTYDHRVVDGADAARFMSHYCKTVSDVRRLLL